MNFLAIIRFLKIITFNFTRKNCIKKLKRREKLHFTYNYELS